MMYQTFAQLYDQLFNADLYHQWADFTLRKVNDPSNTKCLDLAGGTGRLAILLAQAGMQVTVADLSAEMLALASQHQISAGVDLQLVQTDMRDLTGLDQYNLITCYADSLNYLAKLVDVKQTFAQVYQHLSADGLFMFDMISLYQTDQVYPGYMFNYEDPTLQQAFLWSSYQNDDVEHGVIHDLTFFQRQVNGQYERLSETHFERGYQLATIVDALHQVGFSRVQTSANYGHQQIDEQTQRWFFICQK